MCCIGDVIILCYICIKENEFSRTDSIGKLTV